MIMVYQNCGGTRRPSGMSRSTVDLSKDQPVSRLIILQARFQQKQLQEKEEKLLRLYEEQQERAMQRVGSRVQSGGSSVSSTSSVGVGKVRHMFQVRRGNSEAKLSVPIAGRDKSYPLEPIAKPVTNRTHSLDANPNNRYANGKPASSWANGVQQKRGLASDYEDFQKRQTSNSKVSVRRTQSQVRKQKPKENILYFGGSQNDLCFSDELDFGQSFHVIDDHYDNFQFDSPRKKNEFESNYRNIDDNFFLKSFNNKRQFYEEKFSGVSDSNYNNNNNSKIFQKLPNVGLSNSFSENNNQTTEMATPGKYKTFVSGSKLPKGTGMRSGTMPARSGLPTRQINGSREVIPKQIVKRNGAVPSSPARKVTPMPVMAPTQKDNRKPISPTVSEHISEPQVTPPIPASRTTVPRPSSATAEKQPPKTKMPQTRRPASKSASPSRLNPRQDLVDCRVCGRHFASDRIEVHESICQKTANTKRKVFDVVKQRVKGTDCEKFLKKSKTTRQDTKSNRSFLQTNWRKKHEEFITSIRAAKEVQAHLKKGGKLSDLPPPPPSDYSDYIQCPHCGRKFNEAAAERHIPKCANMTHNKPNPNLQKKQQYNPRAAASKMNNHNSAALRGPK